MADRPLTLTPTCPFCGLPIARPKEQTVHRPNEMPVGSCPCGAVYACDLTGHNLGAAFIEALVYSCNMDWDLAWGLLPEEDYQEKVIEKYDFDTHLIVPGGFYEGRKVSGALYFIKLQPDILEVTLNGKRQKKTQALPPEARFAGTIEATRPARKYTNKEIEELVREFRVEALLDIARTDLQIIRRLQRLLYSSDALMRFRAADILGKAAAVIAVRDAQIITGLLQRLLNAVTDPGACGWGHRCRRCYHRPSPPHLCRLHSLSVPATSRYRSPLPNITRPGHHCGSTARPHPPGGFAFPPLS